DLAPSPTRRSSDLLVACTVRARYGGTSSRGAGESWLTSTPAERDAVVVARPGRRPARGTRARRRAHELNTAVRASLVSRQLRHGALGAGRHRRQEVR